MGWNYWSIPKLWEWRSNFSHTCLGMWYLLMLGLKLIHAKKRGPLMFMPHVAISDIFKTYNAKLKSSLWQLCCHWQQRMLPQRQLQCYQRRQWVQIAICQVLFIGVLNSIKLSLWVHVCVMVIKAIIGINTNAHPPHRKPRFVMIPCWLVELR